MTSPLRLSDTRCTGQILTGVLRHYASVLMATPPKHLDARTIREQRSMVHGVGVRSHFHVLNKKAFEQRRDTLTAAYESGAYLKEPDKKGQPANPLSDPSQMDGMMGMMKNNLAMIVPNTLIMSWINSFFSGYVISTNPSPLLPVVEAKMRVLKSWSRD